MTEDKFNITAELTALTPQVAASLLRALADIIEQHSDTSGWSHTDSNVGTVVSTKYSGHNLRYFWQP